MSCPAAVCSLEDLAAGQLKRVEVQGVALCLLRVGEAVHAVEDRCPHRGAWLSAGLLYDGCKVACADHAWSIDLPTGRVEPPETGQVRVFATEVRGNQVFVDLTSFQ